jgi:hypothetical protein
MHRFKIKNQDCYRCFSAALLLASCHAPASQPVPMSASTSQASVASPARSAPSPALTASAEPSKAIDLRLRDVLSPQEILAQEKAYHLKTVRVRGRFLKSSIDAGFPMVYFSAADTVIKQGDLHDGFLDQHQCRGEFEPGTPGAAFRYGTIIVAQGEFQADAPGRPRGKLMLASCTVKKE